VLNYSYTQWLRLTHQLWTSEYQPSLNFHIAVLDREGNILGVNESWLRFARENNADFLDRIGTGKELVARATHNRSLPMKHPLVKVNCAALSGKATRL
jgi:transcriptional regulator of aromatic amino acid metabolism